MGIESIRSPENSRRRRRDARPAPQRIRPVPSDQWKLDRSIGKNTGMCTCGCSTKHVLQLLKKKSFPERFCILSLIEHRRL